MLMSSGWASIDPGEAAVAARRALASCRPRRVPSSCTPCSSRSARPVGLERAVADPLHGLDRVVRPAAGRRTAGSCSTLHAGVLSTGAVPSRSICTPAQTLGRRRLALAARAITSATASPELASPLRFSRSDARRSGRSPADLVAQVVLGAHRRAVRGRDHPAVVRAAGAVERAAVHHVPRPGADPVVRRDVRVVVVVADREEVVARSRG